MRRRKHGLWRLLALLLVTALLAGGLPAGRRTQAAEPESTVWVQEESSPPEAKEEKKEEKEKEKTEERQATAAAKEEDTSVKTEENEAGTKSGKTEGKEKPSGQEEERMESADGSTQERPLEDFTAGIETKLREEDTANAGETTRKSSAESSGRKSAESPTENSGKKPAQPAAETSEGTAEAPSAESTADPAVEKTTESPSEEPASAPEQTDSEQTDSEQTDPETPGVTVRLKALLAGRQRTTASVKSVERYLYKDYGFGTGHTNVFQVKFEDSYGNDVKTDAWCLQPPLKSPSDGDTVSIYELTVGALLTKVLFYGSREYSGDLCFFSQEGHEGMKEGAQWIITHMATALAYGYEEWDYKANSNAKKLAQALVAYAREMPGLPDPFLALNGGPSVKISAEASQDGGEQISEKLTLDASEANYITFTLPKGVTFCNESEGTETVSRDGTEEVRVTGGQTFYFRAPLTQAADTGRTWTVKVKGAVRQELLAYRLVPKKSGQQDLAMLYGRKTGTTEVTFRITWVGEPELMITKTVSQLSPSYARMVSGNKCYRLEGSQYGIYESKEAAEKGEKPLHVLTCGADGSTDTVKLAEGDIGRTVYIREIKAGPGYQLSKEVIPKELSAGLNEVDAQDVPLYASLDIEKRDASTPDGSPVEGLSPEGIVFAVGCYNGYYDSVSAAAAAPRSRLWQIVVKRENGSDGRPHFFARMDEAHRVNNVEFFRDAAGQVVVPLGTIVLTEQESAGGDYGLGGAMFRIAGTDIPGSSYSLQVLEKVAADGTKTVELTGQGGLAIPGNSLHAQVADWPKYGNLRLTKTDALDEEPLPGVTFCLLDGQGQRLLPTEANGVTGDIGSDGVITIPKSGTADVNHIPAGQFTLRELTTGTGYRKAEDRGLEIRGQSEITVKNEQIRIGIRIRKRDAETKENTPQGGAAFEGAEYEVRTQQEVRIGTRRYQPGEAVIASLVLDADGQAESATDALTEGTYVLHERKAPQGYGLGTDVTFTLRAEDDGKLVEVTPEDPVIRGGIKVKKADRQNGESKPQGGASLADAKLEIVNRGSHPVWIDADGDGRPGRSVEPDGVVTELMTDENGEAATQARLLPAGPYEVREAAAPAGYLGPEEYPGGTYRQAFTIAADGEIVDLGGSGAVILDQVIRSELSFRKIDAATQKKMANIPFRITSLTTGESHIVMTDRNGRYDSRRVKHSVRTNAGDETGGDPEAGLWFGRNSKGEALPPEDGLGALPFDIYRIEELPCEANRDMVLWSDEFAVQTDSVYQKGAILDLNNVENDRKPSISTMAADRSGSRLSAPEKSMVIVDTVSYSRLTEGETYTLLAELMHRKSGEPVCDESGEPVRTEKTFVPATRFGNTQIELAFDASGLGGEDVVVFETLYAGDRVPEDGAGAVAEHRDPKDGNQTISFLEIRTSAREEKSGLPMAAAGTDVTLMDTVSCRNLAPGGHYTLTGVLLDAGSGEEIRDASGRTVSAAVSFTAEEKNTTVPVRFAFDGSNLAGRTVVVSETLWQGGRVLAEHKDLSDTEQTIRFPGIRTEAEASGGHIHLPQETLTIVDTVTYTNLIPGKTYTLTGTLMNRKTGEPVKDAAGKEITAKKEFVPEKAEGTEQLTFTAKADLSGVVTVAFETLETEKIPLVVHADLSDEAQTVYVPAIRTRAADAASGIHHLVAEEKARIIDTVSYRALIPGETYTLRGILMDRDTGKELSVGGKTVRAERTFVPEEEDGSEELLFPFDARELEDRTLVVFETLLHGNDGEVIAEHRDLSDADQTVAVSRVATHAADGKTGLSEGLAGEGETVTIKDAVSCGGLIPGKEYAVSGTVVDRTNGKPLLDGDGREVSVRKTFVAKAEKETVELVFTLDGSLLPGRSAVAFETLLCDGKEIAVHADLTDADQTVGYPELATSVRDADTGTHKSRGGKTVRLIDTVSYRNLTPGISYELTGVLMDASTGKPLTQKGAAITAKVVFTPQKPDGQQEVVFTLDASRLQGVTAVVFEELRREQQLVGRHADLSDPKQSISFPKEEKKETKKKTPAGGGGRRAPKTGVSDFFRLFAALAIASAASTVYFWRRRRKHR